MSEQKRVRRTSQQIAADLDQQIAELNESIQEVEARKAEAAAKFDAKIDSINEKIRKLQARKHDLLTPKKRAPRKTKVQQIKSLVTKAQKSGMKLNEIAEKLGVSIEE